MTVLAFNGGAIVDSSKVDLSGLLLMFVFISTRKWDLSGGLTFLTLIFQLPHFCLNLRSGFDLYVSTCYQIK